MITADRHAIEPSSSLTEGGHQTGTSSPSLGGRKVQTEPEWQKALSYTDAFGTQRQFLSYLFYPSSVPEGRQIVERTISEFTCERVQNFIKSDEREVILNTGATFLAGDDIEIVYEDSNFLVINKESQSFMFHGKHHVVKQNGPSLIDRAIKYMPDLARLAGGGIISRLDLGTSGVVPVVKNWASYADVCSNRNKRITDKTYLTIVQGVVKDQKKTIDDSLPHRYKRTRYLDARTDIEVLETFKNHTLVKCIISTGRMHQIRRHMKGIGHPVVGDTLYNKDYHKRKCHKKTAQILPSDDLGSVLQKYNHQALHASSFKLTSPVDDKMTTIIEAEPPEDFRQLLSLLREHAVRSGSQETAKTPNS